MLTIKVMKQIRWSFRSGHRRKKSVPWSAPDELFALLITNRSFSKKAYGVDFQNDYVPPYVFRGALFRIVQLMIYCFVPTKFTFSLAAFLPKGGDVRVVHNVCSISKRLARAFFFLESPPREAFAFGGVSKRRRETAVCCHEIAKQAVLELTVGA